MVLQPQLWTNKYSDYSVDECCGHEGLLRSYCTRAAIPKLEMTLMPYGEVVVLCRNDRLCTRYRAKSHYSNRVGRIVTRNFVICLNAPIATSCQIFFENDSTPMSGSSRTDKSHSMYPISMLPQFIHKINSTLWKGALAVVQQSLNTWPSRCARC